MPQDSLHDGVQPAAGSAVHHSAQPRIARGKLLRRVAGAQRSMCDATNGWMIRGSLSQDKFPAYDPRVRFSCTRHCSAPSTAETSRRIPAQHATLHGLFF
eukprot:623174-Rhodomonas_salina.1